MKQETFVRTISILLAIALIGFIADNEASVVISAVAIAVILYNNIK